MSAEKVYSDNKDIEMFRLIKLNWSLFRLSCYNGNASLWLSCYEASRIVHKSDFIQRKNALNNETSFMNDPHTKSSAKFKKYILTTSFKEFLVLKRLQCKEQHEVCSLKIIIKGNNIWHKVIFSLALLFCPILCWVSKGFRLNIKVGSWFFVWNIQSVSQIWAS